MHSFIISTKKLEEGLEKAKEQSKSEKINDFDIEVLRFEEALGIEDVRKIQGKIFLKPLKGEKKSLILILKSGASIEAQNSMLKLLEEPPPSSLIFIIIDNPLSLLPTILSRAKVVELKKEQRIEGESFNQFLKIRSEGEALSLAQELSKDKNSAILWLEDLILSARDKMLNSLGDKQENIRLRNLILESEQAHYDLKNTNTNTRLVLENFFLNL